MDEAYRLRAWTRAGGYVEAHGTGTTVGDPIETTAIGRAIGARRPKDRPLWIGSVKSNLGHLEPASGVAGLIKLALALHHRTIPPNVHFQTPNPRIPFQEYRLRVPTTATKWEADGPDGVLFAGVNSFGFGGTNAHAVLSSVPEVKCARAASETDSRLVWTVSARSSSALEDAARADAGLESADESVAEARGGYTQRRTHHPHRGGRCDNPATLAAKPVPTPQLPPASYRAPSAAASRGVCQGTQWPGMGPVPQQIRPRATFEEFDVASSEWGRSPIDTMNTADESIFRSDIGCRFCLPASWRVPGC